MDPVAVLEIGLKLTGATLMALSVSHVYLAKLFQWKTDCQNLTPLNRYVFWAHTSFIVVGIFLLGASCMFFTSAMLERTQLGIVASACFTMCWLSRLIFQVYLYKNILIVQNARANTLLQIAGTLAWVFYTSVFLLLFLYQIGVVAKGH